MRSVLLLALLAAILLAESCWFARRHSVTYDETIYLNLSLQSLHDRRLDLDFVSLGVAPLGPVLTYFGPLLLEPRQARQAKQAGHPDDPRLIQGPRFVTTLLMGVPLVAAIFFWLKRRQGIMVAALGGGLAVFSPTLVTHSALATTDAALALFSTLGIAAIAWCSAQPTARRLIVCAVAIAAAMSVKYSGLFLLPVAAGMFLISSVARYGDQPLRALAPRVIGTIGWCCLLICLVLPLWWGAHLFKRVAPATTVTEWVTLTAPVAGLQRQLDHHRAGDETFLMGERSHRGWWYYFPAAYLFKSTPAELALSLFLLILLIGAFRHPWHALMRCDPSMRCWLLSSGVLLGILLTSHLNIGQRHMIPIYPIVIVAGCDRLVFHLRQKPRWLAAAASMLLAGQLASSVAIAPHYMAYFNRASGGPANGWRLLADSNVDWGQDLPSLRRFLETHTEGRVALKYFGTALPEAYGVIADAVEQLRENPDDYAYLAVSATFLDGLYLRDRDPFKAFRQLDPIAQPGYSMMIYDLRKPEARSAFDEALIVLRRP